MPRKRVTVTQKDIREMARILEGINQDIKDIRSQRRSDATVRLFVNTADTAIASDTVVSVTEVADPTMIWDDPNRGWDFSEWKQ